MRPLCFLMPRTCPCQRSGTVVILALLRISHQRHCERATAIFVASRVRGEALAGRIR